MKKGFRATGAALKKGQETKKKKKKGVTVADVTLNSKKL